MLAEEWLQRFAKNHKIELTRLWSRNLGQAGNFSGGVGKRLPIVGELEDVGARNSSRLRCVWGKSAGYRMLIESREAPAG